MTTVVIGAGLAGLTAALALAPLPVTLIVQHPLGKGCSSDWAQGGLAAAVGADDTAELHSKDTLNAGVGLCDAAIVAQTTGDGHTVVDLLTRHGAMFDKDTMGALKLGLEGAHSRRRIVHATDQTGHVIMQAMIAAVHATPSISMIVNAAATQLLTDDAGICGVVISHGGKQEAIATRRVVLATGGAAALWQYTTNPLGNWGHGLALAARAGVTLCDLEFMQFHPTAIDIGRDPMPLASEALRGEGALLIDENGTKIMADYARKDLEPRDVVARALWRHRQAGHKTFLDVRPMGDEFTHRFPSIANLCAHAHLSPLTQPIPVSPAAHYHMGGVATDAHGRTNITGLWACGEVAATGLHGANRLASNSLLEAVSFGMRVAENIKGTAQSAPPSSPTVTGDHTLHPDPHAAEIRTLMAQHVGVLRDAAGLQKAIDTLRPLATTSDHALIGLLIATAALTRTESRGAHTRTDFPATSTAWEKRQYLSMKEIGL